MSFKKDDTVTLMTKDGAERTGVVTKADETEVTVKLDPEAELPPPSGSINGKSNRETYFTLPGQQQNSSGTPPEGSEPDGGRRRGKKTRKSKKSKRSTRRRA